MSTSNHAAILDHLAECMLYLSSASSFWFSLNLDHGHSISLSDRLGMSQHDYGRLLVAADLAQFHNTWGFQIKITQWQNFILGHRFTATINIFEVASKRSDLDAFINGMPKIDRIGVISSDSPRKVEMQQNLYGVMIVTPPRLNRLRIKQQQFRQSMEKLVWNALMEKEKDHKDDKTVDNNDSDNDESVECVNGEKNNLTPFTVTPDKNNNNTMTAMSYILFNLGGFLVRNRQAEFPPERIKTKTNRLMGWIKTGTQQVFKRLPPKPQNTSSIKQCLIWKKRASPECPG